MPRDCRVKKEIEQTYKEANVILTSKTGGFFDVLVDSAIIFSKTDKIGTPTERFPEVGEMVSLLQKARY